MDLPLALHSFLSVARLSYYIYSVGRIAANFRQRRMLVMVLLKFDMRDILYCLLLLPLVDKSTDNSISSVTRLNLLSLQKELIRNMI